MAESLGKTASKLNPAHGDAILPAVSGRSYRITGWKISVMNAAGSTLEGVGINAVNQDDQQTAAIGQVIVIPNVANVQNVANGGLDVVTKAGQAVTVAYYDHTGNPKAIGDTLMTHVQLTYSMID